MNSRIRVAALPLLTLLLTIAVEEQALAQAFPSAPNMVIEANGAGLTRLEVRLLAAGTRETIRYEFRGGEGVVVGGIALPMEGSADYEMTAYDAYGYVTHKGKGSIAGLAHNDGPVVLPLHPTGEGEELIVSLTRERIALDVEPSPETPNDIAVRAHVFDPGGIPLEIKPGDLTWQLTNGRYINLIFDTREPKVHVTPTKELQVLELCDLRPVVSACMGNHCRPIFVCPDPFVKISAGNLHTCALTQAGVAYCWGGNYQGELGAPTTNACGNPTTNQKCSARPLAVVCPPGSPCKFTQISAGVTLTAAVDTNGDVWWWGRGSPTHHKVSAVLAGKFWQVAAGFGHACAISQSSDIWCWGTNARGEAGAPTSILEVPYTAPVKVSVPVPLKFKRVVAGGEHTCAITETGYGVACWGRDDQNQTRGPSYTQLPGAGQLYFQNFGGLVPILDVDASPSATCVTLGNNSGVRCWGEYSYYNVTGLGTPDLLTVGDGHRCATTAQQAKCMGSNNWGEIGIGSFAFQTAAVAVKTPPALYSDLSAGGVHTCGITPGGEIFCWGRNLDGQVGNGTVSYSVKEPSLVVVP